MNRNLVAELRSKQRSNGSWASNNAWTAFGILALRAAGESSGSSSVKRARTWLARQQGRDGGFGVAPGAASDTDNTGSVMQALGASGLRSGKRIDRAVAFLKRSQNGDGGFGQLRGYDSNTQSTAWAAQGMQGVGRSAGALKRGGRTALGYIRSLQRANGQIAYSRRSNQTPVWVTADALRALAGKPFPVKPVVRRSSAKRDGEDPAGADGGSGARGGSDEDGDGGGAGEGPTGAAGEEPGGPGTFPAAAGADGPGGSGGDGGGGPSTGLLLAVTAAGLLLAVAAVWWFRRWVSGARSY
jgi:prenyltransferase beta subunit